MHKKCLITLLVLLYHISFSHEDDRDSKTIKNFNSAKTYPHYNVPINRQQQPYGKHMKVNKSVSDQNNQKSKPVFVDNVRGEMVPQSRVDIYNIKKVTFHGRERPNQQPVVPNNSTKTQPVPTQNNNQIKPSQRNDNFPTSQEKNPKITKKQFHYGSNNEIGDIQPHYVPDNSPFFPLMKPSPINVMPTEPPSFDTVRNYVQYLKMRQQKFFSDFDYDDQPSPETKSSNHDDASYEGEIDYFKTREKELVREEELRNQFSPANYIKTIHSNADDVEHPFTDAPNGNVESELITKNSDESDESADIQRTDNEDDDNDDENVSESIEYNDNYAGYADESSEEDNGREESKKHENFVPFRLYAQVRHVEADNQHRKPTKSNIKAKVSLAKKNIYYKEEGYDDKNYDHGAEKIDYNLKEKRNKKRTKRSTDDDLSQMPVALAYIKKSEISQLTGEKLFKHLDELIKNSSVYVPDDDDDIPIKFAPPKESSKYPYYNHPEAILSQMSAQRYSENLENLPRQKESLYEYKNAKLCENIEEDIDPLPKDIEVEGKPTTFNESPKRLHNLGDKIQCFREKYFGKDPFDNPLFKEDEYVEATIPIPTNHNISRQANPLITVYDDVINNIRSGILSEIKRKREAESSLKKPSEPVAIVSKQVEIPNYSSVLGVAQLPLFDINTFLPKFKGTIGKISTEVDDENESQEESQEKTDFSEIIEVNNRKSKRNNLYLEDQQLDPPSEELREAYFESPEIVRNKINVKNKIKIPTYNTVPEAPPKPISTFIKNIQPTKIIKTTSNGNKKFRRYIPANGIYYPTKQITAYSQSLPPPQSSGTTIYRFKLL